MKAYLLSIACNNRFQSIWLCLFYNDKQSLETQGKAGHVSVCSDLAFLPFTLHSFLSMNIYNVPQNTETHKASQIILLSLKHVIPGIHMALDCWSRVHADTHTPQWVATRHSPRPFKLTSREREEAQGNKSQPETESKVCLPDSTSDNVSKVGTA